MKTRLFRKLKKRAKKEYIVVVEYCNYNRRYYISHKPAHMRNYHDISGPYKDVCDARKNCDSFRSSCIMDEIQIMKYGGVRRKRVY